MSVAGLGYCWLSTCCAAVARCLAYPMFIDSFDIGGIVSTMSLFMICAADIDVAPGVSGSAWRRLDFVAVV